MWQYDKNNELQSHHYHSNIPVPLQWLLLCWHWYNPSFSLSPGPSIPSIRIFYPTRHIKQERRWQHIEIIPMILTSIVLSLHTTMRNSNSCGNGSKTDNNTNNPQSANIAIKNAKTHLCQRSNPKDSYLSFLSSTKKDNWKVVSLASTGCSLLQQYSQ